MITQETAAAIWNCYREIATGNRILEDIAKETAKLKERRAERDYTPRLKDAFGEYRPFQLGVPSGSDSHRLFDLNSDLALAVIRAHIANKEAELVRFNEIARTELVRSGNGASLVETDNAD